MVDKVERVGQLFVCNLGEIFPFREKLAEEPVRILIGSTLPGRVRIGEVYLNTVKEFERRMTGEFLSTVNCGGLERTLWELPGRYTVQTAFPYGAVRLLRL